MVSKLVVVIYIVEHRIDAALLFVIVSVTWKGLE